MPAGRLRLSLPLGEVVVARNLRRSGALAPAVRAVFPREDVEAAHARIRAWPEYATTPIHDLPGLARAAGVGRVRLKDESARLGLTSFKALGAAYAAERLVEEAEKRTPRLTLCCATDGNHGQAVAWAARRLGCRCEVFLPSHALPERVQRITALGARTHVRPGTYDEAVAHAREAASKPGWILITDTSDDAADVAARRVMHGYTLIIREALESGERPTHVFVQAGVGGLAAAVIAALHHYGGTRLPRVVVVEPLGAACVMRRADGGDDPPLDLHTAMDTLAAGEASETAWPVIAAGADAFVAIDDDHATTAQERLASSSYGDDMVALGVSGAAGIAGLLAVTSNEFARELLHLTRDSRVLALGTEAPL